MQTLDREIDQYNFWKDEVKKVEAELQKAHERYGDQPDVIHNLTERLEDARGRVKKFETELHMSK